MSWYTATLLATLTYGVLQGLQKIAATRSLSLPRILLGSAFTVSALAFGATLLTGEQADDGRLFAFAGLNSLLFSAGSLLMLFALRRAPAALVLPVNKLDTLLVVLVGAVVFGERPAGLQWAGAALGLAVVGVLSAPEPGQARGATGSLRGLLLAAGAAFCFAGSMTVSKVAASAAPRLAFVASSYAFTALLALVALRLGPPDDPRLERRALAWGAIIGVLNFVGYLLILDAFARGPLALIQPVFASSMLIAIWISRRALGERISRRQALALVLSLGSVLLIRLGG
jgi:drug/metabolite transporter (DMT)-like permease